MAVNKDLNRRLCQIVEELVQQGVTLEQARREFEKQYILSALESNAGNFSRSARRLGVHRNTLRNKLGTLGIEPKTLAQSPRRGREH